MAMKTRNSSLSRAARMFGVGALALSFSACAQFKVRTPPDGFVEVENWDDVARTTLDRLHREAVDDPEVGELFERLASMPGVPSGFTP